ncbi:MAG TPA: hypothetical protein VGD84_00555 [Pseudonocardiaceae bacterium]
MTLRQIHRLVQRQLGDRLAVRKQRRRCQRVGRRGIGLWQRHLDGTGQAEPTALGQGRTAQDPVGALWRRRGLDGLRWRRLGDRRGKTTQCEHRGLLEGIRSAAELVDQLLER